MIVDLILQYIVVPIFSFITNLFPVFLGIPSGLLPYIHTAISFFGELFSYFGYFVPLEFFLFVILLKTGFYACQFVIKVIKFIGNLL